MTTWDRNAVLFILALLLALWLTGCTLYMPQSHLQPAVQKHLGRALTDSEVDIREQIVGLEVYTKCGWKGYLAGMSLSGLHGCAARYCGRDKIWESEKPCVCQIYLLTDSDRARAHETKHCHGWG